MLVLILAACGGSPTEADSDAVPGAALTAVPSTAMPAGKCTTSITNSGHTAVGKCSGYLNTGTFRVVATPCLTHCSGTDAGRWAFLAGGTSTVSAGSGYVTNVHIEYGPAGG